MGAFCDLTGSKFGRLTVVRRGPNNNQRKPRWECSCECGGAALATSSNLKKWSSQSCGCLQRERTSAAAKISSFKHGLKKTPEHYSWSGMLTRCRNPNATGYERYGALGVVVCERWLKFENFLADMGKRPTKAHTLDRFPNKHGNYEPGNCRWATKVEQQANRRDMIDGHRVRNWKEMMGVSF